MDMVSPATVRPAARRVRVVAVLLAALEAVALGAELHDAAEQGDLPRVRALVQAAPAGIDAANALGLTALHLAAGAGHVAVAEFLLEQKADVNALRPPLRMSPLQWAVNGNHPAAVELLLARGADPNAQNIDGLTALHYSLALPGTDIMRLLLARGARVDLRTSQNITPLFAAVALADPERVQLLLEHGADPRTTDANGATLLHAVATLADFSLIAEFGLNALGRAARESDLATRLADALSNPAYAPPPERRVATARLLLARDWTSMRGISTSSRRCTPRR